jgi:Conserved TM helix/Mechanosensitive ion channel
MDTELLKTSLTHAFEQYVVAIVNGLPGIISGIVILLLGWLVAKLLRAIVKSMALRSGLDGMVEKSGFSSILSKVGISKVSAFLSGLVYLFTWLIFVVAAAEVMHMTGVTNAISALFAYLPTFFTAAAIFLVGLWGGELVKNAVVTMMDSVGLSGGKVLASVLFGIIVLFTSITALNMAGVDTTLITSNIVVVLGGMLAAFCIAYGFAARDILTNILSSYYGKDRYKPGMRVRIGDDEGVIEKIDSISIALRTSDRLVLLPTKLLISERIEVLGELPTITE